MLEFKDVSYVYGKNTPFEMTAVDHVSFTIKDNAVTGLIGHTGSGKSTLAQMTNALLRPTSGTVLLNGQDINAKDYNTPSVRFKVGLVFQYPEYQLFEETVYKDIAYGPHNMGLSDEEIDERVKNAAHFTGLTPDMLEKSPFVIISHSMDDIAVYSDEIIAMSHGKVLVSGTPKEVFSQNALLTSSGLDIPQVTEVLVRLKKAGLPISDDKYTLVDAFEAVRALF